MRTVSAFILALASSIIVSHTQPVLAQDRGDEASTAEAPASGSATESAGSDEAPEDPDLTTEDKPDVYIGARLGAGYTQDTISGFGIRGLTALGGAHFGVLGEVWGMEASVGIHWLMNPTAFDPDGNTTSVDDWFAFSPTLLVGPVFRVADGLRATAQVGLGNVRYSASAPRDSDGSADLGLGSQARLHYTLPLAQLRGEEEPGMWWIGGGLEGQFVHVPHGDAAAETWVSGGAFVSVGVLYEGSPF